MSSLHVFVHFGGVWDEYNNYNGYSVCGVIVPIGSSYDELLSLIANELDISPNTHQFVMHYQAIMNGPKIRIATNSSVAFYLGIKMDEPDKRNYPLCVDVSSITTLGGEADLDLHLEGVSVRNNSIANCESYSAEDLSENMDLIQEYPTIEDMGKELADYVHVVTHTSMDASFVVVTQLNIECIAVGTIFKNKDLLVTSISLFAIKNRFQFKVLKSGQVSYSLKCFEDNCNWTFRASRTGNVGNFKIRRLNNTHTCSNDSVWGNHRQASSLVIASCIKYRFLSGRRIYTPGDVIEDMQETYGVKVSYDKEWRSRELAIKMIRGDPAVSYGNLPSYMYMLEAANPGSYTRIETDEEDKFLFSFVALGASIEGWKHCKPVIVVDGTFLTGRFSGTLFTACTQDANNNIFILAFRVGDAENNMAWEWFLRRLRESYGDRDGLCIMSDRHGSIKHAVEMVYPNALHGACTYHLLQNLKKEFPKKGEGIRDNFNAASRAYTVTEFETHMRRLDSIEPGIRKYLKKAGFERWSRAHMTTDRYSTMTSNIVESVNSAIKHAKKKYPIEALFEFLRCTIQKWFFQNLSDARATFMRLATRHNAMLNERVNLSMRLRVHPSRDVVYQVNDETTPYVINMESKTCSCRIFDLDHLPCPHAVAVISSRNYSLADYCSNYFTKEKYIEAYRGTIYPLRNKEEWHIPEQVRQRVMLPPEKKRAPGRPRENKFKLSMEYKKKSRCRRCGSYGHNSRTCRNLDVVTYKPKKRKISKTRTIEDGHVASAKVPDVTMI